MTIGMRTNELRARTQHNPAQDSKRFVWQTLVLSDFTELHERGAQQQVRFDATPESLPEPKLAATWTADVGWHRSAASTFANELAKPSASTPNSMLASEGGSRIDVKIEQQIADTIAEIAHDIRSPISIAKQIVQEVTDQARASGKLELEDIRLLDQASLRLLEANKWAEGILVTRSMAQGTPVNIRRRFYPAQWRQAAEPLLQSVASRRNVKLDWTGWDRSLPRLYLDENLLTRSILNIVANAVEASPIGDTVTIRVSVQDEIAPRIILEVQDRGRGLAPQLMKQFNCGERVEASQAASFGTGLGLQTAKSLVAASGGSASARIMPTGGTSFTVTLPTDSPTTLLRAWIVRALQSDANTETASAMDLQLYAVRIKGKNSNFCDSHLQQCATDNDFVYRVGSDRWLWFNLASAERNQRSARGCPSLQASIRQLQGQQDGRRHGSDFGVHLAYRLRDALRRTTEDASILHSRLTQLTHILAVQINRLTGNRIPPVDDISSLEGSVCFRSRVGETTHQIRRDEPRSQLSAPQLLRRPVRPSTRTLPESLSSGTGQAMRADTGTSPAQPTSNRERGRASESRETITASKSAVMTNGLVLVSETKPQTTAGSSEVLVPPPQATLAELAKQWRSDQQAIREAHARLLAD